MSDYIDTLESAGLNAQYDSNAKKLLSEKIILAHILKGTTEEFAKMNAEEIVPLIEGKPLVSKVRVEPGLTNPSIAGSIAGMNTESSESGEGKVFFDVLFYVWMQDELTKIIINIEAQRKENPGYPLVNRSIYSGSRLISSQKERDFQKSNYGDMLRVYSIWICFNLDENCMNRLRLNNEPLMGNHVWEGDINLLNIVLVGLNKDLTSETLTKTESDLHYLLGTIFSDKMLPEQKIKLLKKRSGMPDGNSIREELEDMCNLSYGIEENAIERERFSTIINMLLDHVPKEKIKQYTNASDKEISDAENEILSKTK